MFRLALRHRMPCAASIIFISMSLCCFPYFLTASEPPAPAPKNVKQRPSQKAVLAKNTEVKHDIPYGKDEKQRLDLYVSQGIKDAPVVVFVHGGEWSRHDKSEVSYKPKFLNEHGIVLVSINYRLSPSAKHPEHVDDVASAIRWVHDHIGEYGGNPRKIFLLGHSAGCHLVTLVSLDPRYLAKVNLRPSDLRGVVAWSGGAYDLVQKVKDGGMYADYIKKAFGDSEDAWRDASPVAHVKDLRNGPSFLFISIKQGDASHKASKRLAELIRDANGNAESKLIKGRDHFEANHLLGAPEDSTGQILLDFIHKTAN